MATTFRTYYFDNAVTSLPDVLDDARKALAGIDFDTIVGTGFSGGIVIPALALSMDKKFVLIRKEGDDRWEMDLYDIPDDELPGMWERADFMGGES